MNIRFLLFVLMVTSSFTSLNAQEADDEATREAILKLLSEVEGVIEIDVFSRESIADNVAESVKKLQVEFENNEDTDIESVKARLQTTINKHLDKLKNSHLADPSRNSSEVFDKLLSQRESFVEQYSEYLLPLVKREPVPEMEASGFQETCRELGVHLGLKLNILAGAVTEGTEMVQLKLPRMDCGGCASRVRESLIAIEGVNSIETVLEGRLCQFYAPDALDVEESLNELAKSVVQFKEWSRHDPWSEATER